MPPTARPAAPAAAPATAPRRIWALATLTLAWTIAVTVLFESPSALYAQDATTLAASTPSGPAAASGAPRPDKKAAACRKKKSPKARRTCLERLAEKRDPRRHRGLYVDPQSTAALAGPTYARIARQPHALWLTDGYYTPENVRSAASAYVRRAERADKTAILSLYAIPDRDCGLYSAGGLPTAAAYRRWVGGVAKGLRGSHPIVVVEPDAVAYMGDPQCADAGPRQALLANAVRRLSKAGAWVYLDAGHSAWRTPAQMAVLLQRSGVRNARGFSTNVANFRPTADEQVYARAVTRALASRGVRGARYVIETARNGARPAPPVGDVCNPVAARLGRPPKLVFRGAFDGTIWVKPPGESDGPCNGGPAAGTWWPEGAKRLLGR